MAEALEGLPQTSCALEKGETHWSSVRELCRVATAETESGWLQAARGKTVRQIERLVAGHAPGELPDDPSRPDLLAHVLRLRVSNETYATFREAVGKLRQEAGGGMDDEEALLMMARRVLGGPEDKGRSGYQISMTVCPECGRGSQRGHGELVEVGPEVVEMAECDAQTIGVAHVGHTPTRASQSIPPAVRRQVIARDHGRCVAPGCRSSSFLDIHHLELRSEGGSHDPDKCLTLCGCHHRAAHRGTLVIEGSVSEGLSFRHADGTRYGYVPSAHVAAVFADTFQALTGLGFGESQSRRLLDIVRQDERRDPQASVEQVLRAALRASRRTPGVSEVRQARAPYAYGGPPATQPEPEAGRPAVARYPRRQSRQERRFVFARNPSPKPTSYPAAFVARESPGPSFSSATGVQQESRGRDRGGGRRDRAPELRRRSAKDPKGAVPAQFRRP